MTITKTRSLAFILLACLLTAYFLLDPMVSANTVTVSAEDFADGGDVSNMSFDLSANAPLIATRYIAGNGYVYWEPDIATLTLSNAEMNVVSDAAEAIIILPESDINIILEGNNFIGRTYTDDYDNDDDHHAEIIQQGEFLSCNRQVASSKSWKP